MILSQNGCYTPEVHFMQYGAQVDIIRAQNCDGYNTVGGCVRRDRPSDCVGKLGDDFEIKKGNFTIINSANASRPSEPGLVLDADFGVWICAFIEDLSTATHSFVVPNSVTLPPKSPDSPPRGKINATHKGLWIGTSCCRSTGKLGFAYCAID
ncbi:unnamed protein product [Prunus armeniaca]